MLVDCLGDVVPNHCPLLRLQDYSFNFSNFIEQRILHLPGMTMATASSLKLVRRPSTDHGSCWPKIRNRNVFSIHRWEKRENFQLTVNENCIGNLWFQTAVNNVEAFWITIESLFGESGNWFLKVSVDDWKLLTLTSHRKLPGNRHDKVQLGICHRMVG